VLSDYWSELGNTLKLKFKFAFLGLCTSVCAHTCSLRFWHDHAHSSFYSCLPHLPPLFLCCPSFCSFMFFSLWCACLSLCIAAICARTQNGKTALDYAKECDRADRRAEVVALLEWWEGRCDVAAWYQGEAIVSSPISGMIVGSFLCPLSPPFFCALWLFTRLPLNKIHVICRCNCMSFSKWSLSFCCLLFMLLDEAIF